MLHKIEELAGEDVETRNEASSGPDFTGLPIPHEMESPSIFDIHPDEATITWQTYETTLLIQAEIDADIELEGFVYKSDVVHLDQLSIQAWDWNDYMAKTGFELQARLIFQMRFKEGSDSADECELAGAKPAQVTGE